MKDSLVEYSSSIERLKQNEEPFILATVVKVHGSASAKVGSKAIFDQNGRNIFGWIGGGCAERFVGEQAIEALREKAGRIVLADLDDEVFGLGVACGGKMEVFIDPVPLLEEVSLPHSPQFKTIAEDLAFDYGLKLKWNQSTEKINNISELFLQLANSISLGRGKSGRSLRDVKDLPVQLGAIKSVQFIPTVSILGKGRIVEALEKHFLLLGWKVRCLGAEAQHDIHYQPGECVVIASHASRDRDLVKEALEQGASYVGMVGSRKRAFEVIEHLGLASGSKVDLPLFIPAGVELDAKNPNEIALSIVTEILQIIPEHKWN